MKKAFFTCFTGILLICAITNSYSQNQSRTAERGYASLNEISTKAVRNFRKDYENVADAKWCKFKEGYVVNFTYDSIDIQIIYDRRGNYKCMIRMYSEDILPKEVRHLVKSNYYDFRIFLVKEVRWNNKIAYMVTLEDKTSWKTIKVVDDEMEVVEELLK